MKVIVTHHGPDYRRKKWSFPARLFLKFSESVGLRFANAVIAIADNISNDLSLTSVNLWVWLKIEENVER